MINGQNIIFNFKFFYWAYWEQYEYPINTVISTIIACLLVK